MSSDRLRLVGRRIGAAKRALEGLTIEEARMVLLTAGGSVGVHLSSVAPLLSPREAIAAAEALASEQS